MFSVTPAQRVYLVMAVLLYAIVLLYQGYIYGSGDQTQILPCLYAQDHPEYYKGDHYVRAYLQAGVNERTVFHFILRHLGYSAPWMIWIWHAVCSIALILAWLRIAAYGLKTKIFQFLGVAAVLIIGFHTSTGGNELYYNSVVPSLVAKAIGSWALFFWLEGKYRHWITGLIIATFLQPLVGLQLYMLTMLALLLSRLVEKAPSIIPWRSLFAYIAVVLPWIFLLRINNGSQTDPEGFMEIMAFRLSHHFYPSAFGWFHLAVLGIMVLIAIRFYHHRLRWFMLLIVFGCVVYTIGVEFLNQPTILYSQWFKTTIWLEAFAFLAVSVRFEKWLIRFERFDKFWYAAPVFLLLLVGTYRLSGWFGSSPQCMLPFSEVQSAEVDISLKAKDVTDIDAVFIVPVEFSAFRWYAKRSLYIDYKALFHKEEFLKSWYNRIGDIYAFSSKEKASGFELSSFSRELLAHPEQESIAYWKNIGITHIVSTNPDIEDLEKLAENDDFAVYKL